MTNQNNPKIYGDTKNEKSKLKEAFSTTLFLGIILILLSIINNNIFIDSILSNKLSNKLIYIINIINEIIRNIGIALLIAYVFSFVSSTQTFMNIIRERLVSIIITKDFLSKVNNDERRDMIKKIIKYTEEPVYIGVSEYFDMHITQSLSLFNTHFRSSYQINANAKFDKEKGVIRVDSELRFRMYKVCGNFEKLNVGFEDEDVESQPLEISTPNGEKIIIETQLKNEHELEEKNKNVIYHNGISLNQESVAIIEKELEHELKKYDYLDCINRFSEFGNENLQLLTYRITKPCDKLSIYLSCDSGLIIKKYIPFGELKRISCDWRNEKSILDIFCNDWIEAGFGVAILIGKK